MIQDRASRLVLIAALDRSGTADRVVATTIDLASRRLADVHLLHVVERPIEPMTLFPSRFPDLLQDARAFVEALAREVAARIPGRVAGHAAVGSPHARIIELAADVKAELIVVGARPWGPGGRWGGSVSRAIVAGAPCAVVVARDPAHHDEPAVEPPCPDCVLARHTSSGERTWCPEHARRHVHAQLHYALAPGFGAGSMFLQP